VVILVSLGHTTTVELQRAAESVTRGGARLAGIVLDTPEKQGLLHRSKHTETAVPETPVAAPVAAPKPIPETVAVEQPKAVSEPAEGLVPAPKARRAVAAVDARTEEIPKIDAPLNGSAKAGSVNGHSAGAEKNGANGHLTSSTPIGPKPLPADAPATPAPTPWFTESDDAGNGDETDFAQSRRMM